MCVDFEARFGVGILVRIAELFFTRVWMVEEEEGLNETSMAPT